MSPGPPGAPWWRTGVVYEIYVRSFADSDGDGVGDLAGATARLPALARLGVDAVWLTPFYRSPQADHGYDVADHRDVDPLFGDLAAFDALVTRAHGLGLRVVVDVVPNHVSAEHPWFRAALAAGSGQPERRRFHIRPGRGRSGQRPPNNWRPMFGGPAWTRLPDGEWYLHLFAPEQPDLAWDHPDVRTDLVDTVRFWAARGVDGFRVDVAGGLAKDPEYGDVPRVLAAGAAHPHWDRPEVHDVYREWRGALGTDGPFGVAEAWGTPERTAAYADPRGLGQSFAFDVMVARFSAAELGRRVRAQLAAHGSVGALPAWVLGTHDTVRVATRQGLRESLALHLFLLAMPGAFYLYQGDELGLPEVEVARERWQDPQVLRSAGALPSRDGARVPVPWEAGAGPTGGFGFTSSTPWLPVPADWTTLARDAQEADPASPWSVIHRALAARRELWADAPDDVEWLQSPPGTLTARRGDGLVLLNTSRRPWPLARLLPTGPGWTVATSSTELAGDPGQPVLAPTTTTWLVRTAE